MKAVIYARYSAGPNQTVQSIEGQLRVCKDYIEENGWTYAGYYADKHISGRTDQRPQFQAMINAAEKHEFDVLVVYSSDRFSRDKFHSVSYKHKLKELGIKVKYAAENIPEGPEGIFLESIMESWAQYYSEELSRKVKRGMSETARKCKSLGGRRTYGYRTDPDGNIVVDEEEAFAIRHVFYMITEGETITAAAKWLNDNGYVSSLGKPYSHNSVKKMLTNKRYIGYYIWDSVEIPDGLPSIIDKKTFYDIQQKFEENRRAMPKNRNKYLLSGKLFCGNCGSPMTGASGTGKLGKKYSYYRCRKRDIHNIPKDEIEDLVVNESVNYFSSDQEMDQLVDMLYYYMVQKNASERESRVPKSRLLELRTQRDNLITVIAQRANASLVDKLEEIEAELARLEAIDQEERNRKTFTKEELRISIKIFFAKDEWPDPERQKAKIIKALIKEVHLFEDHIDIIFNIQIDPDDPDNGYKKISLEGFDQSSDCSTIGIARRTLLINGYLAITKNRETDR